MLEVDVTGLSCPLPVLKVKKAIEENPGTKIKVLSDSGCSQENITRMLESKDLKFEVQEEEDSCSFIINKEGK